MTDMKVVEIPKPSCKNSRDMAEDIKKWADNGEIVALGVNIVFTNGTSYSDYFSDQPVNIDILIGGLERLKQRIIEDD